MHMNKNIHEVHMNMWFKTTFILQLYMECVCEILTGLKSTRLWSEWGCLQLPSPCDRDSTQGWPSTQFCAPVWAILAGIELHIMGWMQKPQGSTAGMAQATPSTSWYRAGHRHTEPMLLPSLFFSGYLQQFLPNKGLILYSIKFYSGAFWSKPALHWDITGKDEELCCHPCTPKGRRVDALQHFLHSQGDTHNEFCHLHFMPDLAGCIWWFLGGRMLTAQWFLPKPPFSSTLFQKEKQLLLSWTFGATCPIGCWKGFQGCANIPKQRFGFRGTVIEW